MRHNLKHGRLCDTSAHHSRPAVLAGYHMIPAERKNDVIYASKRKYFLVPIRIERFCVDDITDIDALFLETTCEATGSTSMLARKYKLQNLP